MYQMKDMIILTNGNTSNSINYRNNCNNSIYYIRLYKTMEGD